MTMKEPRINSFCWVELAANNSEDAKKFYRGLFGFTFEEEALPEGMGTYITAMVNSLPACALFTMPSEMKKMNIPPHWSCYVRVESCDKAVAKAKSLGAEVLKPPFDVMEAGRMATVKDPFGAVFHLWEKKAVAGAAVQNEVPGSFSWNELLVSAPEKALEFYGKLFGWTATKTESDGKIYYTLNHEDGYEACGLMALPSNDIPPHWGVYFTVSNIKNAVAYVKENGGKVFLDPQVIEEIGRFAICSDTEGAKFSLFEFKK